MVAPGTAAGSATPIFTDPFARKRKRREVLTTDTTRTESSQDRSSLPQIRDAAGALGQSPDDEASACGQPPLERESRAASSISCENNSVNQGPSKPKPKHIPIIIPPYVPLVSSNSPILTPDFKSLRSNSVVSIASHASSQGNLSNHSFRRGSTDSNNAKPQRHVEIVIPDWAQPVQTLPDTPVSLVETQNFAKSQNSSSPRTIKPDVMSGARQPQPDSRTNTLDSNTSAPSASQLYPDERLGATSYLSSSRNGSSVSLSQGRYQDGDPPNSATARTFGAAASASDMQTAGLGGPGTPSQQNQSGLSGIVCNVHRTTGREPRPSVGATTTILGDKLYVFGGRRLGRTRNALTNDLYELDLIRRHWTKVSTTGDVPAARYFHSVCALGDTKLVCYGGMSPAPSGQVSTQPQNPQDPQPEVVVMSDIHVLDVQTRTWTAIHTREAPQGRYAHCATILPSSASFTSPTAPLSAIQHNPSSGNPNQGQIGHDIDGLGGAEMVIVGGQDSANHYIEQISVFNLRSLKWTSTSPLERSCGAYRSVVASLDGMKAEKIGMGKRKISEDPEEDIDPGAVEESTDGSGSAMLIYSNYNFLDVKLELQVRLPDGALTERSMYGNFSPPGLRFPNGGVINDHFVVSGTFLTSSKQEYALWALDLRTLTWSRIEVGNTTFSQGSWNRGILWRRRNTFVILGNRRRNLVEDYNHRRINFGNICLVELEAFGLYDNPRKTSPASDYASVSGPPQFVGSRVTGGGRNLSRAAEELGQMALGISELSDMDLLAIGGERIPVNSRLIARRWGPYFNQLLREGFTGTDGNDSSTLRPGAMGNPARFSSLTITPSSSGSVKTSFSSGSTMTNNSDQDPNGTGGGPFDPPNPHNPNPSTRPRTLFLPHTHLTIQALIQYLYTGSLPPASSPLCTPQILCSLLQFARPYHVDGLLEATLERLHTVLDGRNVAAIFNAAAMAAGGGDGIAFLTGSALSGENTRRPSLAPTMQQESNTSVQTITPRTGGLNGLKINTDIDRGGNESEPSSAASSMDSDVASSADFEGEEVWSGELSAVIGLQKRGLRGLMEGRRMRDMGRAGSGGDGRIGLGIV